MWREEARVTELKALGSDLICFEDDHLLVVNKPSGINTHSPSPYAGEGIYEWLRDREAKWAELSILHRLDKETSGVMVFGKTPEANRSLTRQFTEHTIRKKYRLWTDRAVPRDPIVVVSSLIRAGERYISRPLRAAGERSETRFKPEGTVDGVTTVLAEPITGRTHQIRVHAAESGFPVLGDALYGGGSAQRLCLHAEELRLKHPVSEQEMIFRVDANFDTDSRIALREAMIDRGRTNAFRLANGAADGFPGWYADKIGEFLLSQSAKPIMGAQRAALEGYFRHFPELKGAYDKRLNRAIGQTAGMQISAEPFLGEAASNPFTILENGIRYEVSFKEGYSMGLFLDQRDNRRRFLTNYVARAFPVFPRGSNGAELLNTFAYTCGFSVCAAAAGARTTSIDLSKKYLEWGKRNFALNGVDAAQHNFIYGDVFDWLRRLAKKGKWYDAIVLDPPTFSQSKRGGTFQAEKDYAKLVSAALPLLGPKGVLLASSNAANLGPEKFIETIDHSCATAGRKVLQRHYVPQPIDFRITKEEPAYLKTIWLRVA
jgi:23S rRNA (cytosine1962-C5)-methyltransferase